MIDLQSEKLLSAKEAGEFLGVGTRTLLTYRKHKGLPSYKIGGKVRYARRDLVQWQNEQKQVGA